MLWAAAAVWSGDVFLTHDGTMYDQCAYRRDVNRFVSTSVTAYFRLCNAVYTSVGGDPGSADVFVQHSQC